MTLKLCRIVRCAADDTASTMTRQQHLRHNIRACEVFYRLPGMLVIRFNRQDWAKGGHHFWVAILAGSRRVSWKSTGIIDRVGWFGARAKVTTR